MANKLHVKKGDKVKVLSGKDKGKEGVILRAMPSTQRVVVEKVNMITKTIRPNQNNPQGGLTKVEGSIHASNVMLICPECNQPTRTNAGRNAEGKKVRICKKCGKEID